MPKKVMCNICQCEKNKMHCFLRNLHFIATSFEHNVCHIEKVKTCLKMAGDLDFFILRLV